MSLKEHPQRAFERFISPSAGKVRNAFGSLAVKYHERLGEPTGKHSRTHDFGPRPDVGEVAMNAGYDSLDDIPALPASTGEYQVMAPELIDRIKHPKEESIIHPKNDSDLVPLYGVPAALAPRGPAPKK